MGEIVRLTLVAHALTDAMSAGRFPADEPLNERGRLQLGDLSSRAGASLWCAPELRARQTAEVLGPSVIVRALADLDCGAWRGRTLDSMSPAELAVWSNDPHAAPHGGESLVALIQRVRTWLDDIAGRGGRHVAVTHPAVIRAAVLTALDAPASSFWRLDIAPARPVTLHFRGRFWVLRS